jgi:hypothetical protein
MITECRALLSHTKNEGRKGKKASKVIGPVHANYKKKEILLRFFPKYE